MEGPNVRWTTEDGELPRERRAPGASSLGWRSACSAEELLAPARDLFAPAEDLFAPAGESAARGRKFNAPAGGCLLAARDRSCAGEIAGSAGFRWLPRRAALSTARSAARRGSRLLDGPSARSGPGPAPSPLESFAPPGVRRLRRSARLLGRPVALVGIPDGCAGICPPASATGMSPPAIDLSARRSIRWLRGPIRRLAS